MQNRWNTIRTTVVSLLVILHVSLRAQAQDPLTSQLENYMGNAVQEKIYLHSDKNFYVAGELCWFKLYDVDATYHKPLDMSKVAYAELIDNQNKPVLQAKISLKTGVGNGSFRLPADIASGNYKIRAYTNWMKNFSADLFFEKEITIVNAQHFYESDTSRKKKKYAIQFFPEGGNMVNGTENKLAFKITDQYNKGVAGEGFVISSKQDTLVRYSTLKFGMGSFLFTPQANENYKSVTILPGGESLTQELPTGLDKGYVMRLSEAGNNSVQVTVQASGNNDASLAVYLLVHTRGIAKVVQANNLQNGQTSFTIDKSRLGDGISHFTLFNAARTPVCERLYFKFPIQRFKIDLTADKDQYATRRKINIRLRAADKSGQSLPANLSMAVYRLDSLQKIDELTIDNYLWLISELGGIVESPAYYFANDGEGAEEAMDNLLLTQGWRRFRWTEILSNKKPAFGFVPEYAGHIIRAKVTDSATGIATGGVGVNLSTPGTRAQFRTAVSDPNGMINFDMKDFFTDDGELILQTRSPADSLLNLEVLSPFSDKFSANTISFYNMNDVSPRLLSDHNGPVQIQNRFVGERMNRFHLPGIDTIPFYGKPDVSYLLDSYVRFTTIEEVLREYVAPVTLKIRSGKYDLKVLDKQREHVFFEQDPLVLLNGVPVIDFNRMITYDPLKVRKLDIITQTYYYGNMAFAGLLNFITYNGHLQGFELDPHATVVDYEGLQSQREFYSPEYDTPQKQESRLPDFRNLLFWSPDINTTSKGESIISFYSSDLGGKYVVVVQGLSADGRTGNSMIQLTVTKRETGDHQ